ncbi:MAG: hypothetical protein QXF61_10250 [Nitrososphaeria archaeon]
MQRYVVVPNIVEVNSNVDHIPHFALGPTLFKVSQVKPCQIKVYFLVYPRVPSPLKLQTSMYPFRVCENVVYYEHPLFGVFKLQIMLSDLQNAPKIFVNNEVYRLIQRPIGNLPPAGVLCTDIIWAKLAMKNMSIVYSSCISLSGDGILLLGHSGAGKSLVAYLSQKKANSEFLSEDVTIVDEKRAYACPYTQSFLNEDLFIKTLFMDKKISKKEYLRIRFLKSVRRLLKPSLFLPFKFLMPPPRIKITDKVQEKVDVKRICLLERGDTIVKELDKDEMIAKILLLNRLEFYYERDPFLTVYSLYNPDFEYERLLIRTKEILTKLVEQADCFLIKTNNPYRYLDLIQKR